MREKRILATGYNGAPSGLAHCEEVGCLREASGIASGEGHELCRGLHAEQNAILQAALHGVKIEAATVYTTHQPCVLCAKMLINAGIKRIVYRDSYPDELAQSMLAEANVKLETARAQDGSHDAGVDEARAEASVVAFRVPDDT